MPIVEPDDAGGVRVAIKAVPGSSRDQIVGALGDRLKIKVAAAPEGGKANKAICRIVAQALGVPASAVTVLTGATAPEKTLAIAGVDPDRARAALGV